MECNSEEYVESAESEELLLRGSPSKTKTSAYSIGYTLNKTAQQRQVALALCSSLLFGISYGFALGYSSPAIPNLMLDGIITKDQGAWFASSMSLGTIMGIPLGGWIINRYGRQKTMVVSCIPAIVAWLVIVHSENSFQLSFGRILNGLSGGVSILVVPIYIAEVAAKHLRGKLSALTSIGTTSGILIMYSLGLVLTWKQLAIVSLLPIVVQTLFIWRLPETPRFLILHGQKDKALATLEWLHARPCSSDEVMKEYQEIETAILSEAIEVTWSSFLHRPLLRPIIIISMLMLFHIFCGITVVVFYTQNLFEDAGFHNSPGVPAVVLAAVKFTVTTFTTTILDHAGRKVIFATGGFILCISCIFFGLFSFLEENHLVKLDMSLFSLASILVYIVAFSLGWNSIPWLIMSEIFPARARGKACTIACLVCNISGFIVASTYFYLQALLHLYGIFWIFGLVSLSGSLFVIKYLPETKGRSLEEITAYFQ